MKKGTHTGNLESHHLDPFTQMERGSSTEARLAAIDNYIGVHSTNAKCQYNAGEMYLETAYGCPNKDNALLILEDAMDCFQKSVKIQSGSSETINQLTGRSLMQLAFENIYRWNLMIPEELPPNNILIDNYNKLIDVSETHSNTINLLRKNSSEKNIPGVRDIIGNLAEIDVLLLSQRFGLKLADRSWLAIPAFHSEDMGRGKYLEKREAWDLSIITHVDPSMIPELNYKIQVKSSSRRNEIERAYSPDIKVVYVNEDLTLNCNPDGSPWRMPTGLIAEECLRENRQIATIHDTSNLDIRENKLLDILG